MKDGGFIFPQSMRSRSLSPLLYESLTSQFDLNKPVCSVLQMNNSVTLKFCFIPVMVDLSSDGLRIDPQISDAQILKK